MIKSIVSFSSSLNGLTQLAALGEALAVGHESLPSLNSRIEREIVGESWRLALALFGIQGLLQLLSLPQLLSLKIIYLDIYCKWTIWDKVFISYRIM